MCGLSKPNKVIVAANPVSGQRGNRRLVQQLAEALVAGGLEPCVVWDQAERKELLGKADAANGYCCVIVAGGDGTVGDVLNEQPKVPLAVAPLGTENLFAQEFGFTRDMSRLTQAVKRCECRTIDLGMVNGRRFGLMLSAGFDSEVVRRATLARRKHGVCVGRGGRLVFIGPTIGALLSYRYPRVQLEADGEVLEGAHVFVFNISRYAMGLNFIPDAHCADGMLDWMVLERPGFCTLAGYFFAVFSGKHLARPDVRHGRARKIRITSAEPMPLQVDGDAGGSTPAEVEALPATVQLIRCD